MKQNAKEFLITRNQINKVGFVIFMLIYYYLWYTHKPVDTPTPAFIIGFIIIPICMGGFMVVASHYLYLQNWYHSLYFAVCGGMFLYTMTFLDRTYHVAGPFVYEIGHLFFANIIGASLAIGIAFPFKLVHFILFEPKKFYFEFDLPQRVEDELFPEKKAEKVQQMKQKFVYDTMSETQLQVELSVALKEERFEDADKIQKILGSKFK